MHSYVTLCALLPPVPPPTPRSLFLFFLSFPLSLHALGFVDHLLRENPPRKQDSAFRGPISRIRSCAAQPKCKAQIKPDHQRRLANFQNLTHLTFRGGEETAEKPTHYSTWAYHTAQRQSHSGEIFSVFLICICASVRIAKKKKYMERTFRQTIIILL